MGRSTFTKWASHRSTTFFVVRPVSSASMKCKITIKSTVTGGARGSESEQGREEVDPFRMNGSGHSQLRVTRLHFDVEELYWYDWPDIPKSSCQHSGRVSVFLTKAYCHIFLVYYCTIKAGVNETVAYTGKFSVDTEWIGSWKILEHMFLSSKYTREGSSRLHDCAP